MKYLSPGMNRKKNGRQLQTDNNRQQQTDGGDDNTWNGKFPFQVKSPLEIWIEIFLAFLGPLFRVNLFFKKNDKQSQNFQMAFWPP